MSATDTNTSHPGRSWTSLIFITIFVMTILVYNLFTVVVDQSHKAVVRNFGHVVQNIEEPGMYLIMPWETVTQVDRRLVLYQSGPREATTQDKKTLMTSSFALWQVGDPATFINAVNSIESAITRIDDNVYSVLKNAYGVHDYADIVANDREGISQRVTTGAQSGLHGFGIDVALFLINRVEMPEQNKQSTFDRMTSERLQIAQGIRSSGTEQAQTITSQADRDAAFLLADANRTAAVTRGQADAEAAQIYADAYSQDPEFYQLMRGLEAAKTAFGPGSGGNLRLILDGNEAILKSLLR